MDNSELMPQAGGRHMPPEELAMQALTKQLYKSRLFRGYYMERCLVEQVSGYRDVVVLQRSERELEKLLHSSAGQLQKFYQRFVPNMWVGITYGSCGSYQHKADPGQLETCIWTEINDIAFGEYWFSIKTLRFRDHEVQFKLKMVRPVEPEPMGTPRRSLTLNRSSPVKAITTGEGNSSSKPDEVAEQIQLGLDDFLAVLQQWGDGVKQTVYEFMANDVNKRNILGTIRFMGLLIFSALGGAALALRFLGVFAVRFLFELSRFTHTATPIVFKLIEFLNKIVGAFFILLTMIWKDIVTRGQPQPKQQQLHLEASSRFKSIQYERSEPNRRSPRW
ncbi:uncharacterized protein LOC6606184 [Drosophila sechellia]|uniref:GM25741 n=1 Tax=Drosophila sechellia TaxID=7238 RepID=B4HLF8_DROSE|nr:uncharacterized protein LOC6606184 [Drosophila sechellia]XP_032579228.1 uncharacterized protein LOC6606184 [Drosophila sechellia]EDW41978.1 GM25741 [Drosophila sechellia]